MAKNDREADRANDRTTSLSEAIEQARNIQKGVVPPPWGKFRSIFGTRSSTLRLTASRENKVHWSNLLSRGGSSETTLKQTSLETKHVKGIIEPHPWK